MLEVERAPVEDRRFGDREDVTVRREEIRAEPIAERRILFSEGHFAESDELLVLPQ
jgi:hypothetical protein